MEVFTEKTITHFKNGVYIDPDDFINNFLMEASETSTYLIREKIYPKIEKVLDTPDGRRKFERLVSEFINRNGSKLTAVGPLYNIPFTHKDHAEYFSLFGVSGDEIYKVVDEIVKQINDKANFTLLRNNPIYILLYCVIRYFTIKQNEQMLKSALIIMALAFYPSIYKKYYKYDPNPDVMAYTIDNLSKRYIIKKSNTLFGTLTYSITNSWKFHEKNFYDGSDKEVIRFIQRIRNDQNSLMKKITNNYRENHAKGLSITTQVDAYDNSIVVDNENDTNRVEYMTTKIVTNMLVNGIDYKFSDFAASASNVSKIELRNYLTKIASEKNSNSMKSFIESILFIYLYDEKHTYDEINSKQFIAYALALFKKTNAKNDNINNIKLTLEKWATDSGIYARFNRLATRNDYSKGIFLYFILSIQKYV